MAAIFWILIISEMEETTYLTLVAVVMVISVIGLWTAVMRRLTDTGRSKAIVLLGVVPFLNLLLWYFLLQEGIVPYGEEELDGQMGNLLDRMDTDEKSRFVENYTAAATPYLKYNCIEREKRRIEKRQKRK